MRLLLSLTLASVLACGIELELPPSSSTPAAITDGSEDPGHPAVGKLLFSFSGGSTQDAFCTATIVGPRTVLTAAHCLLYPNTELVLDDGQRFRASRTIVHPDYDQSRPYLFDLGLALLAEAPAVRPLPLDLRPAQAGTAVTLVGYGRSAATQDDQGIKRLASNTIASVEPDYLTVVGTGDGLGNACHGDSGGPLLVQARGEEVLVGLLSYIIDLSTCGTTTYATRLDLFDEWLVEAAGDLLLVDHEPPQITFLALADGQTVRQRQTVEVRVEDNVAVAEVALLVDGQQQGRFTAAPYLFSLKLDPGQHQLQALAWDEAGNQGQQTITVRVDPTDKEAGCHLAAGSLPGGSAIVLLLVLLLVLSWGCWRPRRRDEQRS